MSFSGAQVLRMPASHSGVPVRHCHRGDGLLPQQASGAVAANRCGAHICCRGRYSGTSSCYGELQQCLPRVWRTPLSHLALPGGPTRRQRTWTWLALIHRTAVLRRRAWWTICMEYQNHYIATLARAFVLSCSGTDGTNPWKQQQLLQKPTRSRWVRLEGDLWVVGPGACQVDGAHASQSMSSCYLTLSAPECTCVLGPLTLGPRHVLRNVKF